MRLLEFPCGRRVARPEEEAPRRQRAAVALEKGTRRRRAWRPSLVVILEDKAMVTAEGGTSLVAISEDAAKVAARGGRSPVKGGAAGLRKARASSTRRVEPRPYKDANYGDYGVPAVVPAFAPAAFMF